MTQENRCIHDVHGEDCFTCYPTQDWEENNIQQFLKEKYEKLEAEQEPSDFMDWVKKSDKELINFILEEVSREVEEIFIDSKNIDYDNGYATACKDISTIISQLKVK